MHRVFRTIVAILPALLVCTGFAGCGGEKPTASQLAEIDSALTAQQNVSGASVDSNASSGSTDVDGDSTCTAHAPTYHTIPQSVIALVSPDAFASFQSQYDNTEDFNIAKFVQLESIDQAKFTAAVDSEGLNDAYPVDIVYSGDQNKIDDYYRAGE